MKGRGQGSGAGGQGMVLGAARLGVGKLRSSPRGPRPLTPGPRFFLWMNGGH